MEFKPEFFNKEIVVLGNRFYQSSSDEHDRVYVPKTKVDFETFIDALWEFTAFPSDIEKINYELVKRYPFIFPKNVWDGGIYLFDTYGDFNRWFEYNEIQRWMDLDTEYTMEFLEILTGLLGEKRKYTYFITDIKEKYGELRWYDYGRTAEEDDLIETFCKYMSINYIQDW